MKARDARKLLEQFAEFEVDRVIFGPFYVSIDFLGVHNVYLRVNKPFTVRQASQHYSFELEAASAQPAASLLVSCVGSKVAKLELAANMLTVQFSNSSVLSVQLGERDFEPIEISCCHHLAPNELLWLTTVEAE